MHLHVVGDKSNRWYRGFYRLPNSCSSVSTTSWKIPRPLTGLSFPSWSLGGVRPLVWDIRSWPRKHTLPTVPNWDDGGGSGGPSGAIFCGAAADLRFHREAPNRRRCWAGELSSTCLGATWNQARPGLTRRTLCGDPELTGARLGRGQSPHTPPTEDRALAGTCGASGCRGRLFPSALGWLWSPAARDLPGTCGMTVVY